MNLHFEWDRRKASANLRKHGISFDEALTVFADPLARIFDDEEHSEEEHREIIIGHSINNRLILVHFTARKTIVRLFSVERQIRNAQTMKKTPVSRKTKRGGMRAEYRFDYQKAKPNRFASKMAGGAVAIILEPDVAAVFKSSESVNALLRSVISALPESKRQKTG
jgi:uncharacterized DUF497 family protein